MLMMEESASGLPWDPLREQDWNSLGVLGDESVMESALWDGAGDGVVGHGDDNHGCDGLEVDESGMPCKVSSQFSPMTIDAQFDCFWDNFPGHGLPAVNTGSQNDGSNIASQAKGAMEARPGGADPEVKSDKLAHTSAARQQHQGGHGAAIVKGGVPTQITRSDTAPSLEDGLFLGVPPHLLGAVDGMSGSPFAGATRQAVTTTPFAAHGEYQIVFKDKNMLLIPLAVVAIADGILMQDIPPQMRTTLEQASRRMAKEPLTVIQARANDGSLVDLKVRAFSVASPEAAAINEYIARHPAQVPAPFVVLHSHLDVGVAYDAAALEPAAPSGVDRLRKKIKAHVMKTLREVMADGRCRVSADSLAGMHGAMAVEAHLRFLVDEKMTAMDEGALSAREAGGRRILVVPTKKPRAPRDESKNLVQLPVSISGSSLPGPPTGRPAYSPPFPGPGSLQTHMNGGSGTRAHYSPDASQPSTPGGQMDEDGGMAGDGQQGNTPQLTAYFPVNLFVTAIADGQIASDTPTKVAERLGLIVRKVPKEQNTSVEISDAPGPVPLQMRVFVVNSEDAKAVGEYIHGHMDQVPAPFVVLAQHLPMAVLYDPATLDLSDASVADRLRKQAKTRAVKVLREAIGNKAYGITMRMLRGHEGAMGLAHRLRDALGGLLQQVDEDPAAAGAASDGKYVVFAARNKATSVPNSPRKRRASCSSPLEMPPDFPEEGASADGTSNSSDFGNAYAGVGGPHTYSKPGYPGSAGPRSGGGGRKGGAATVSNLHRNMLDRNLANKRHKKELNAFAVSDDFL